MAQVSEGISLVLSFSVERICPEVLMVRVDSLGYLGDSNQH